MIKKNCDVSGSGRTSIKWYACMLHLFQAHNCLQCIEGINFYVYYSCLTCHSSL